MLTMTGIRKSFAGNEVLHGVDFEVSPGQVHGLVGHNGAGKSTLMKVLGGSYPDYEGTIEVDGEAREMRTPSDSLEAGVAIIYQDFALVPDLDVAHNLALGREPGRKGLVAHGALKRRSEQDVSRFGINLRTDMLVRDLGVADQQLTEIVRALSRDVRYLVMDEPTARLAPAERAQLFSIMRQLTESGVGIVYISHFLDEVVEICDDITILRDGAVVARRPSLECTSDSLAVELVGDEEGNITSAALTRQGNVNTGPERLTVRNLEGRNGSRNDLTVHQGEIVALAGLVGSGRTSFARAIVGARHAEGEVRVDGVLLNHRTPRKSASAGLVLVPEDRKRQGLILTSDVAANIELTALGTSLSKAGLVRLRSAKRLVSDLIERFRVRPADPTMLTGSLSGGNAQKVLVARAMAAEPKVLVLDQPTAGVDVSAKAELHQQVAVAASAGTAVIVISDDLDEMLDIADRIVVVAAGKIVGEYPADTLDRATLLAAMSKTEVA